MQNSTKRTHPGLYLGIIGICSQVISLLLFIVGVIYDLYLGIASGGLPAMNTFARYLWVPFILGVGLGFASVSVSVYYTGFSKSTKHSNPGYVGLILGISSVILAFVIGFPMFLLGLMP